MAKFTNKQLVVLSNAIVDRLEEKAKEQTIAVRNSDEYKNFENEIVKENPLLQELVDYANLEANLQSEIDKASKRKEEVVEQANKLLKEKMGVETEEYNYFGTRRRWYSASSMLEYILNKMKKEKFADKIFNREQTLNKVQAEILLGDVSDAKEVFDQVVTKFSSNE